MRGRPVLPTPPSPAGRRHMSPFVSPAFLLLLIPSLALAQGNPPATTLRGRFLDVVSKAPVPTVEVKLIGFRDTTDVHRATSNDSGRFEVQGLTARGYRFEAKRIG